MVNRLFAIATVMALGGVVASISATGCGSGDEKDTTAKGPPRLPDGGLLEPSTPASDKKDVECKAKTEFKEPETKPVATKSTTACPPATVNTLADACIADPNAQKCTDARTAIANKQCADCIYGSDSDANAKVVVLKPGEDPGAIYNQEGCIENVTGVKGCGHAYMTVLACFVEQCGACGKDDAGDCLVGVADNECKPYRITDEACDKATGQKSKEIGYCFPQSEDDKGIRDLFFFMAGVACGGLDPTAATESAAPAAGAGGGG